MRGFPAYPPTLDASSVDRIDTNSYLVEAYSPHLTGDQLEALVSRARAAAREVTHEGTPVALERAIYVPADETCFHLFEAVSITAIEAVTTRAGLAVARIVEAVEQE